TTLAGAPTAPPGWTCGSATVSGTVSCTIPSLATGSTATVTIVVNVVPDATPGTVLTNRASVLPTAGDPNQGDNTVEAFVTVGAAVADLEIVKTDAPDPVRERAELTYTVTATNHGGS